MQAYEQYRGSQLLKERYSVTNFLLLTATTTPAHRLRLLQTTAQVLGRRSERYLFCLAEDIHPFRIGEAWTKMGAVHERWQTIAGRAVRTYLVDEAPHVLLAGS